MDNLKWVANNRVCLPTAGNQKYFGIKSATISVLAITQDVGYCLRETIDGHTGHGEHQLHRHHHHHHDMPRLGNASSG